MTEQLSTIIGHVEQLSVARPLRRRADRARARPDEPACEPTPRGRRGRSTWCSGTPPTRPTAASACRRPHDRDARPDGGAVRRAARRARGLLPRAGGGLPRPDRGGRRRHPRLPAHAPRGRARRGRRLDRDGRTGLQGVPIALKDILCTKGEETTAGSRILEGFLPIYDGGCVVAGEGRRARLPRQDQHGRVRDGLVDRELRLRRDPQPVGRRPRARAARRAARPRRSPPASRRSRSAPTPAARSASRPRSAASSA